MFQIPPPSSEPVYLVQYWTGEPVCLVQYWTGEIVDLTYMCGQTEKQQRAREGADRRLTPEQHQLIELQRKLLQENAERQRREYENLIQRGVQLTK